MLIYNAKPTRLESPARKGTSLTLGAHFASSERTKDLARHVQTRGYVVVIPQLHSDEELCIALWLAGRALLGVDDAPCLAVPHVFAISPDLPSWGHTLPLEMYDGSQDYVCHYYSYRQEMLLREAGLSVSRDERTGVRYVIGYGSTRD